MFFATFQLLGHNLIIQNGMDLDVMGWISACESEYQPLRWAPQGGKWFHGKIKRGVTLISSVRVWSD